MGRNHLITFTYIVIGALPGFAFSAQKCPAPDISSFHENPRAILEAPLIKYDENCKPSKFTKFNAESIADKSYIEKKDQERKKICHTNPAGVKICLGDILPGENVPQGKAPIDSLDRAENLVPSYALLNNLEQIEAKGLKTGKVSVQPWSDWYWPISVGQLSYRYNDPEMMRELQVSYLNPSTRWSWFNDWHNKKNATPSDINALSPAEKYDLLMGDTNYTLTKNMLAAGSSFQKSYGKVEDWMGLCHGWSPASYMLPRPSKALSLSVEGGAELTFLPTDLKALATLLWSNGKQQNRFVGGRCNKKNPEKDRVTGKILDQNCFDTNPGSWHMSVVSQIGNLKRPMVMDATYDYEVWNHPIVSYSYSYFNPKTMVDTQDLNSAKVPVGSLNFFDKFKDYRSLRAKTIVGVSMEVEFLVETMPSERTADSPSYDRTKRVHYTYDLELDEEGRIIGGEWYTNKHPDFLWTPYENSKATSVVDDYISFNRLPLEMLRDPRLQSLAPYASENGQPIGKVVEALLRAANQ